MPSLLPSLHHASRDTNGTYWSGIAGILAIHLAILFFVAVAGLAYLNWSSNAALADFIAKDTPSASEPGHVLQSSVPVQQVKSKTACAKRA